MSERLSEDLVVEVCHDLINRALRIEHDDKFYGIEDGNQSNPYREKEAAIRSLLAEARHARSMALTKAELAGLELAREVMSERASHGYRELSELAVVALDKLLAAAKTKG